MNKQERAAQIWPVLIFASRQHSTITYEELARLIGVPRQGLGQLLEPIQSYCLANELPALTSLVVSEKTGLPGTGFTGAEEVPSAQAAVYQFDWFGIQAPTVESFA